MVERSCPQAFLDAYETHLETDASSEQFPDVELHPDAEHVFKPEGLAEVVRAGCVVRIERTSPSGDVMMQVVGVTSGGHMTSVLDILHEAGWVQPFPEVEP